MIDFEIRIRDAIQLISQFDVEFVEISVVRGYYSRFYWRHRLRSSSLKNRMGDNQLMKPFLITASYEIETKGKGLNQISSLFQLCSPLIIFHELAGRPALWWFGDDKVRVFYAVRLFLGLVSAVSDTVLVVALSRKYGKRLATYALAMLYLTSGCFFASTSFFSSSFSMYAMSLSSGLLLFEKYAMAVAVLAVGVILGWPFSILAFYLLLFTLWLRDSSKHLSLALSPLFLSTDSQ